jgi:hypothetical protein
MEGRRLGEGGSSSRRMGNTGARQFGTAGEEENAEGDRIGGGSAVVLVLLDAEGIVGRRASSIDWGIGESRVSAGTGGFPFRGFRTWRQARSMHPTDLKFGHFGGPII